MKNKELKLLEKVLMASIVSMANNGTLTGFLQDCLKKQNEKLKKPNPFKVRYNKINFPDTIVLKSGLNYSKPIFYMEGEPKVFISALDVGDFVNSMIADGHHINIRPI